MGPVALLPGKSTVDEASGADKVSGLDFTCAGLDVGWLIGVCIPWESDVGPELGAGETPSSLWKDV